MVELKDVFEMMDRILKDRVVPKNIKVAVERAKKSLESSEEPSIKIAAAIQTLDEVINEPNVPIFTRTQIWNIVSNLEEKMKDLKI